MKVHEDKVFYNKRGKAVNGFYIDGILKTNIDKYLIRAVKNDYDGIVVVTGAEGCVFEDEEILAWDKYIKIKDIDELSYLTSLNFKNKKLIKAFAKKVNSGIKEVYEVETESGKKIRITKDHVLFTEGMIEKRLEELKAGDRLLSISNFEKIKSIKSIGKKQTYDLIVPDYNNFIFKNGIISHNSGKTVLASILAYYCDNSFPKDCSQIVFTPRQIMAAIDTAKKGDAIVIDEAILSMGAQDAATDIQKVLIKKFVTIRKKNLYIFIIIPSFFMLRKYFAIFRTRFLINCYAPDGVTRGFFGLYNRKNKRQLYIRGSKEMDSGIVRPNYKGRFTDTYGFFFDAETYEAKKDFAIASLSDNWEEKYKEELRLKFNEAIKELNLYKTNLKIKYIEKMKENKVYFRDKIKEYKNKNESMIKEINDKIRITKSLKRNGEITELIDFRDKMLYYYYKDKNTLQAVEELRNNNLLHTNINAIQEYIERGKNLLEIVNGLK